MKRDALIVMSGLIGMALSGLGGWTSPVAAEGDPAALPRVAPTEPTAVGKTFRLKEGFTLELVAAEPLVTDPVAAAFDEAGRLYVVEMNDYPYTDKSTDKPNVERTADLPLGKVRLLEDRDDDGVFEHSVIFARELSWPTGIAVYDGGVFVAATPDLWYLKDTDGDGQADVRRKVFAGFRKLNVQAVVNNLIWGLDHRIYGAGGTNGGQITQLEQPDRAPIAITRHDFRFDPREPRLELQSGGARFGNTFDDWGHRFICNIRNPIQQIVLPLEALARNPQLPIPGVLHDVAVFGDQIRVFRDSPPEPWRVVNAARLMSQGDPRMPRSEKNAAGYMTSACAVTIYRGDAYPPEFREQVFLCEPSGNLVHRQRMIPQGVTFSAERIDVESEFLTSTDNWFRPVNLIAAPDGTLYLLDMYRETIEHPWSMPDDLKALLDLEHGRDRGRIYRITPPDFHRRATPRLDHATTPELIALLEHPNVWHRETAHRLLFERQDPAAVAPLRQLVAAAPAPLTRLHALWSLVGLGQRDEPELRQALRDAAPMVRVHALRLAETTLPNQPSSALGDLLGELVDDPDPRVRLQLALTLGALDTPRRAEWLEAIARRDAGDPWITIAVLSAAAESAPVLSHKLLEDLSFATEPRHEPLLRQLVQWIGVRNRTEELRDIGLALSRFPAASVSLQGSLILSLDDGLRRTGSRVDLAWRDDPALVELFARHWDAALRTALSTTAPTADRVAALRVVACQPWERLADPLFQLLDPREPQEIQVAAVKTIAGFHDDQLAARLLETFPHATPAVQYELIEALANHPARLPQLLDAIATDAIPAGQLTPIRKLLLFNHADPEVRRRATELLGPDRSTPRADVVRAYQPALAQPGDGLRGMAIFRRECATCHRLGDHGHDVGPNLATVRHRRGDELLVAILDPHREVGPNFMQFAVTLDDGRVLAGMIAEETPVSLTLRQAEDKRDVVLRANIDELRGTGLSLMPEGLEKKVTVAEMADLLAYLRGR
jgi:putative membrane-bound dehydrogenase-like protein